MNKNNKNKQNSNPMERITMFDAPLRLRLGLSTLASSEEDDKSLETGFLVSEVGFPTVKTVNAYPKPFVSYNLRAPRTNKIPSFIYGSCALGDTFSAFIPKIVQAPAVGSNIVVDPYFSPAQSGFVNFFKYINYDVHWIVHVPSPLGTGIYLKIYAPEVDTTIETRGIRFKPSAVPTVALYLPYSNDLALVPVETGRKGQCGGSIVISTVEDNSIADVNTPLNITVFCAITNVRLTGWNLPADAGAPSPCLNFQPVNNPAIMSNISLDEQIELQLEKSFSFEEDLITEEHMDEAPTNEVTAETAGESTTVTEDATEVVPLAPEVEKPIVAEVKPNKNASKVKPNTKFSGTKWFEYQTITVGAADLNVWKTVNINPYTFTQKGEAFNLPFKRNVWTSGTRTNGYMQTIYIQLNISRPPQVSGLLYVKDSSNASSTFIVQFGEKVEIPLIPVIMNGKDGVRPRDWTTPWMRSNRCSCAFQYKLVGFNRTTDIADTAMKIMVRQGNSVFSVPTKPVKRTPPAIGLLMLRDLRDALDESLLTHEHSDTIVETFQNAIDETNTVLSRDFITPFVALTEEACALHEELGNEELIDLDEFPVLIFDGEVNIDEVTEIPIVLPAIPDLNSGDPLDNAITQKFDRFENIIPRTGGSFGPVVGSYTIKTRLPTSIAGEIQHLCLPGDMVDQTASLIFGLDDLLGIAGAALSSVGGPLLSGFVSTASSVLSGAAHAIGGDVVGGLADSILGNVSGMLGNVLSPTAVAQPSGNAAAITGDISISRYPEMIKPIVENYLDDPVFPTLLVNALNFLSQGDTPLTKIPIQVLANMRNVNVEREVFNRTYNPSLVFNQDVTIPSDQFMSILEKFVAHPKSWERGTKQNDYFIRFQHKLRQNRIKGDITKSITIRELRAIPKQDLESHDFRSLF